MRKGGEGREGKGILGRDGRWGGVGGGGGLAFLCVYDFALLDVRRQVGRYGEGLVLGRLRGLFVGRGEEGLQRRGFFIIRGRRSERVVGEGG